MAFMNSLLQQEMVNEMAAVQLQSSRHRPSRMDIFVPPSKSIQAAKRKLGLGFYDTSVLESSRNAIELSKLVTKWDEIDKAKMKVLQAINHEKFLLLRSLKRKYYNNDSDKLKTELIASKEGIETVDGKNIPPGFRFTANGDIKKSTLASPILKLPSRYEYHGDKKDSEGPGYIYQTHSSTLPRESSTYSGGSRSSLGYPRSQREKDAMQKNLTEQATYASMDFEREIQMLQEVISDIVYELSKAKPTFTTSLPAAKPTGTFLRAHSHEPAQDLLDFMVDQYSEFPTDRVAFDPEIKKNTRRGTTPSYRTCSACQFKLHIDFDHTTKLDTSNSKNALTRRWSYVPSGRYVSQPGSVTSSRSTRSSNRLTAKTRSSISTMYRPLTSSGSGGAQSSIRSGTSQDRPSPRSSAETVSTKASSRPRPAGSASLLKRTLLAQTAEMLDGMDVSDQPDSDYGLDDTDTDDWSNVSTSGLSNKTRKYVDYDQRMELLKEIQMEEKLNCDERVREFLEKFDDPNK